MSEKPFTPKTLAERWSCSESYIYRLMQDGRLKCFHIGGKLKRIAYQEVLLWEGSQSDQLTSPMPSENTGSAGSGTASAPRGTKAASVGAIDLESARRSKGARNFMRLRDRI